MITIRQDQMAVFAKERHRLFIERMCCALREQFPEELLAYEPPSLRVEVTRTLERAKGYSLESEQDCHRYLNLAVIYGWDFDQKAGNEWMRDYLTDTDISSPGKRLHRLVDRCLYLEDIAAQNASLRREMAGGSTPDNGSDDLMLAMKE